MNVEELKQRLTAESIDESAYSLSGGLPGDRYVLSHDGPVWSVYYSERGLQTSLRCFQTESEACSYLLQQLLNGLMARKH